jgi:uncharacterized membrane protein HdeD (DUF308 family)
VFGISKWIFILVSAVVTGILGGLLLVCSYATSKVFFVLLGASSITYGVLIFFVVYYAVKNFKQDVPQGKDDYI